MPKPARADLWLDFSYSKPPPDTPCAGIIGYLSSNPAKNLTRRVADGFLSQGKRVLVVWQEGKTGPVGGAATGMADAAEANRQADNLGYPTDCPIVFATDFDPTAAQVAPIVRYYEAVKARSRRPVGAYGGARTLDHVHHLVELRWQTKAWSGGRVHPKAHLLQENGAPFYGTPGVDENTVLRPFRAWGDKPTPRPHGRLDAPAVALMFHRPR